MKIIAITDIHDRINYLSKYSTVFKEADLVLISGDITHFGHNKQAKKVFAEFIKVNDQIFAVSGNCDYPDVKEYMEELDISLSAKISVFNNIYLLGCHGSLPCPGRTPQEYEESYYRKVFNAIEFGDKKNETLILVTHQPPFDTKVDKLQNGTHVGSTSVREFIENHGPILCICGHIHEGIGIDTIGSCKIVNPGPFFEGKFAEITLTDGLISEVKLY
jgi:Icc-related predicted phosphoesterase